MRKKIFQFIKITLLTGIMCFFMAPAAYGENGGESPSSGTGEYIYFYVAPCDLCDRAAETLDRLEEEAGPLFLRLDLYQEDNLMLYYYLADMNNIPDGERQAPVLFFEGGFTRDFSYESIFEAVTVYKGIDAGLVRAPVGETPAPYGLRDYLIFFGVGFLNGLNPCSISMILLLFSLLTIKRLSVIKLGLAFVLGKLATYLAIGLLLHSFITLLDNRIIQTVSRAVAYVLILISITLAVLYFLDFLAAKKERYGKIRVQLPRALRDFNNRIIEGAFIESRENIFILISFGLAVIVSVGEFICTGQIYLAAIIYLSRTSESAGAAVFPLLAYTLAMIIPSAILTVLVAKGRKAFELSEFFRKNMPAVKLAGMAFFLIFALYLIIFAL